MRRRNLVFLMVGAVLLSSLITWLAAVRVRSPAEVAARTGAPDPTPILVSVEQRVLMTRVVTRGTAHFGSPREVVLTPSHLKSGPRIVTGLASRGQRIRAGEVLATVSGRPVFLLEGAVPSYRDLGPGITGPDVRQVEAALRRLGLGPGPVDGVFDSATAAALSRMYERAGHVAVTATDSDLARARPAEATMVPGASALPGVQLPSDEVVFLPDLPIRVSELPLHVGAAVKGALATVTDSDVVIDALVPVEQSGRVEAGDRVIVDEPSLGIKAEGTVASLAGRAGTGGADAFHVALEVTVPEPPPELVGVSVRLTIPVRSTRTARLTVPVSAVSLGPDGGSRVEKSVGGGTRFIDVETGFSAEGYVAVTPTGGTLTAGDKVVVGLRGGSGGA